MKPKIRKHPCNERFVIEGCATGELSIDDAGRVWRHKVRRGKGNTGGVCLVDVPKHRAEFRECHGYLRVQRQKNKRDYKASAARLVYQFFRGDIPDDLCINHKNGVKTDNRPENLELVTYQRNSLHAARTGLRKPLRGEGNGQSKLREVDVLEIRQRYKYGGVLQRELAEEYGVAQSAISQIISRHTWKHLQKEEPIT